MVITDCDIQSGGQDRPEEVVFEAIRQLMAPPPEPSKKKRIGFLP